MEMLLFQCELVYNGEIFIATLDVGSLEGKLLGAWFCDLNLMPGLFDAVQSRNIEQLHKAIEEGKDCNINEDDIREANDVLMEELRKARNQTKLLFWKDKPSSKWDKKKFRQTDSDSEIFQIHGQTLLIFQNTLSATHQS